MIHVQEGIRQWIGIQQLTTSVECAVLIKQGGCNFQAKNFYCRELFC